MLSENIYNQQFCVYIIVYKGNKLPPFYIGSGVTSKIIEGKYLGSPSSKEYKDIWKQETKSNRPLFKIKIIKTFCCRNDAFDYEKYLQSNLRVAKNPLYVNMGYANQSFNFYNKKHNKLSRAKMGVSHKANPSCITEEQRKERSNRAKNKFTVWDNLLGKYIRATLSEETSHNLNIGRYIAAGKLRSTKSRKRTSDALSDRYHCYDPSTGDRKFLKNCEDVPNGYIIGLTPELKQTISNHFAESKLFYDPETGVQVRIPNGQQPPNGYVRGRLNFGKDGNPFTNAKVGIDIRTKTRTSAIKTSEDAKYVIAHNCSKMFKLGNYHTSSKDKMQTFLHTLGVFVSNNALHTYKSNAEINDKQLPLKTVGLEIIQVEHYVYSPSRDIWL